MLAAGIIALILSGCSAPAPEASEPAPETTTAVTPDESETPAEASFADNVLTLPEYTIKITDAKMIAVVQPGNEYSQKPVIAFWYEVTNLSDEPIDPTTAWISSFTALQDNDPNAVNELNVGTLPDEQFLDSQLQEIKKDGTVANAASYELDDETTPVELVASNDLGATEIGRATFTLQTLSAEQLRLNSQVVTVVPDRMNVWGLAWLRFGDTDVRSTVLVKRWTADAIGVEVDVDGDKLRCWIWQGVCQRLQNRVDGWR